MFFVRKTGPPKTRQLNGYCAKVYDVLASECKHTNTHTQVEVHSGRTYTMCAIDACRI